MVRCLLAQGLIFFFFKFPPAEDPEVWDITLNGIEDLFLPTERTPSTGCRPSTPGNHHMQTRSRTPQRAPAHRAWNQHQQGATAGDNLWWLIQTIHYLQRSLKIVMTKFFFGIVEKSCVTYRKLLASLNWSVVCCFPTSTETICSPQRQGQYMKKRRLDTWYLPDFVCETLCYLCVIEGIQFFQHKFTVDVLNLNHFTALLNINV